MTHFAVLTAAFSMAQTWQQVSLGYIDGAIPTVWIKNETGPKTVPADSGTDTKWQRIYGAANSPPTWDSRFSPTPTYDEDVDNDWFHDAVVIPVNFAWRFGIDWWRAAGWQEFERYDDEVATGIKVRRDKDWYYDGGFTDHLYPIEPEGPGGPGGGS